MVHFGPRQRLQPGGAIVIVMTVGPRKIYWTIDESTNRTKMLINGRLLSFQILPSNNTDIIQYWKLEELEAVKASLTEQKWQAQWQQKPTSEEGSIIKREWWQRG